MFQSVFIYTSESYELIPSAKMSDSDDSCTVKTKSVLALFRITPRSCINAVEAQ
jgi:hypothetical protein